MNQRVFREAGEIYCQDIATGRTVWSTLRPLALLFLDHAVTLSPIEINFPDFYKSNGYAHVDGTEVSTGLIRAACVSWAGIDPQEWTSSANLVATVPVGVNYIEVGFNLTRVIVPSTYMGFQLATAIAEGGDYLVEGGAATVEAVGPIVRGFAFELGGVNAANPALRDVTLSRTQSVGDAGSPRVDWVSDNNPDADGNTYDGNPNAWPAYILDQRGPDGSAFKKRYHSGSTGCSLVDTSDYSSSWRGTVTITPGYIKP